MKYNEQQNTVSSNYYPQPVYSYHELINIIIQAAQHELHSCKLYWQLTIDETVNSKPSLNFIAHTAFEQDWKHYLHLIKHIQSIESCQQTFIPRKSLSFTPTDMPLESLLHALKEAEYTSIEYHEKICSMTLGHDYQTFDLAYSILNDNIQHRDNLEFYTIKNA